MDFFNRAFTQLSDLFRSMSAGARITSGLLLVVVVVSLAWLFHYQATGPSVYLLNGEIFTPEQQAKMAAAFGKANLTGWSWETSRFRIPRDKESAFMAALAENDALPESVGGALRKALKDSTSPFTDGQLRQEMVRAANQTELAGIICQMSGIDKAFVSIGAGRRQTFGPDNSVTASVSVAPKGNEPLSRSTAMSICHLVAKSLACRPENVAVIDTKHNRTYIGQNDLPGGGADSLLEKTREWEEQYVKRISEAIRIDGAGISVSVVLDPERVSQREVKPGTKPTPIRETEETVTKTQEGPAIGGPAGVVANQRAAVPPTASKGTRQEEEQSKRTTENLVGRTETQTDKTDFTPKSASASVSIPTSHLKKLWQQRNPAAVGETPKVPQPADLDPIQQAEIARVKSIVGTLLTTITNGAADPSKNLAVTTFEDLPPEEIPEPGMGPRTMGWLAQHWSTLGLALLALVSLGMLRSMVRAAPATATATVKPVAVSATAETAKDDRRTEEELAAERRLKRLTGSGKSLRDELSELVSEDPDAAANILRTWVGNTT